MAKHWIEHRAEWGVHQGAPPACSLSWFWSPKGNMRARGPHVRLTMPAVENTQDCTHWMPYAEGDEEPMPPGKGGGNGLQSL